MIGKTVAALYVDSEGVYAGISNVDAWDQARDARKYDGPYPVVAHQPHRHRRGGVQVRDS